MIEIIGKVAFYAAFGVPAIFLLWAVIPFSKPGLLWRLGIALSFAVAAHFFFMAASLSILLRDGLGPDATHSEGIEAWMKSLSGFGLGFIWSAPFILAGVALALWYRKRSRFGTIRTP